MSNVALTAGVIGGYKSAGRGLRRNHINLNCNRRIGRPREGRSREKKITDTSEGRRKRTIRRPKYKDYLTFRKRG